MHQILVNLKKAAAESTAQYPQYKRHYNRCVLGRATKKVSHRGRLMVDKWEYVLIYPGSEKTVDSGPNAGKKFLTVWSKTQGGDVSIPVKDVEFL